MSRSSLLFALLLGLAAGQAYAQSTPSIPSSRPADLSGASRAQFARVQRERNVIANQLGLSRRTVDAIALVVLGQGAQFTDTQLVVAVREQAGTARRLLEENKQLVARI